MRVSTDFPGWLASDETRAKLQGKNVLMYCTGGTYTTVTLLTVTSFTVTHVNSYNLYTICVTTHLANKLKTRYSAYS